MGRVIIYAGKRIKQALETGEAKYQRTLKNL